MKASESYVEVWIICAYMSNIKASTRVKLQLYITISRHYEYTHSTNILNCAISACSAQMKVFRPVGLPEFGSDGPVAIKFAARLPSFPVVVSRFTIPTLLEV